MNCHSLLLLCTWVHLFLIFFNSKILVSFSRNIQNSFNKFSVVKIKLELQQHSRSEILLALIILNVLRYIFGKVLLFGFDSDFLSTYHIEEIRLRNKKKVAHVYYCLNQKNERTFLHFTSKNGMCFLIVILVSAFKCR